MGKILKAWIWVSFHVHLHFSTKWNRPRLLHLLTLLYWGQQWLHSSQVQWSFHLTAPLRYIGCCQPFSWASLLAWLLEHCIPVILAWSVFDFPLHLYTFPWGLYAFSFWSEWNTSSTFTSRPDMASDFNVSGLRTP